jgi:hypothetical protein
MATPARGKRALKTNRMDEVKVGLTPGQWDLLEQLQSDNPGMSERGAVRHALNAGFKALGVNARPAVAGSIGLAPAALAKVA